MSSLSNSMAPSHHLKELEKSLITVLYSHILKTITNIIDRMPTDLKGHLPEKLTQSSHSKRKLIYESKSCRLKYKIRIFKTEWKPWWTRAHFRTSMWKERRLSTQKNCRQSSTKAQLLNNWAMVLLGAPRTTNRLPVNKLHQQVSSANFRKWRK